MKEGYFNRKTSWREIADNLRWALSIIARSAPWPAVALIGFALLEGISPVLSIYVTQHLIDGVIQAAGTGGVSFAAVMPWLLAFAGTLLLTDEVIWKLREPSTTRLLQRVEHVLGRRRLTHASRLPLLFYEESASYDKLSRSDNPGRKVAYFFTYTLLLVKAAISVVGIAGLFWRVSPWLAVALVVVSIPRAIYGAKKSQRWMSFTYDQTEEQRKVAYMDGLLTGRAEQKEMRVFDLAGPLSDRWISMRREQRAQALKVKTKMELGGIPSNGLYWVTEVVTVVLLALWLGPQRITPGVFISLFQGVSQMDRAAGQISFAIGITQVHSIETGYVRDFLNVPAQAASEGEVRFPDRLQEGVRLSGVSFTYPGRERPILDRLDLHLRPGERVALVGENGAGKSTLVKLLLGLYKPDEGTITADGTDYTDIPAELLHANVTAAYQDYYKFSFTAGQSIALGDPEVFAGYGEASHERVVSASLRGGADEFISGLPKGYDTPVGHLFDGSQGLSGGQWQRIAISRTFMRDPQLLILDEPTAALDAKAEAEIYEQFVNGIRDRAVLLISHRLGSARLADRIVVLSEGRIIEDGTHDELIAANGSYAQMWEVQSQWYR